MLLVVTAHRLSYVGWMFIYLISLPVWNFILPTYAYWKFDDFSWGETRKTDGEKTKTKKGGYEYEGEFDGNKITMKRWHDFEKGMSLDFNDAELTVLAEETVERQQQRLVADVDGAAQLAAARARVLIYGECFLFLIELARVPVLRKGGAMTIDSVVGEGPTSGTLR